MQKQNDAAVAAIGFALETEEGMTFLRLWNEGEFTTIREEWPECPDEVFIGAEPGFIGRTSLNMSKHMEKKLRKDIQGLCE